MGINSVFADPNNIPNKINHATHIKYRISNINEHVCARMCVCYFASAKSICNAFYFDTFNSFSHSANPNIIHAVGITLAQVDFCTLANDASCSSKREHIPHKYDTKWFRIKHSFIRCTIIYCSQVIFKIICNFLGVNFFLTHTV